MTGDAPQRKYRKDYRPPAYLIDEVELDIDIRDGHTDVSSRLSVRPNPDGDGGPLVLDGREMTLTSLAVDGRALGEGDYRLDGRSLTIGAPPAAAFELTVGNRIEPEANTALEGLYRSGEILCTQCEANGFSRITYFPDRPDVMARYRVRLEADADRYPVLLANGNRVEAGEAGAGRHYAVYEDPFAKPCYLFAAVAGDLACVTDTFRTASGRDVALQLYTEHGNEDRCGHALASLKQAMAWDERVYGLEYDLDVYMIVAVGSFNMGAMENKGLNIFNTACILATPETATDRDFATVRDVVAHEYFHNYTGNRVTCRDWFQLSLKESLTVFREQQFAADHGSPGVTRIEQVRLLREIQFPEDAGPNAHPVRPESYVEMNNFYTITIYEKGAEIIRMMARILGRDAFVEAVRHYLRKHDGRAVTIEDFVVALEESAGVDLGQFRRWYEQPGTPRISAEDQWDADTGEYRLTLRQHPPSVAGPEGAPPLHVPVALGLVDPETGAIEDAGLLELHDSEATWRFPGRERAPVPSLLRGFSAPVRLDCDDGRERLLTLLAHDDDPVARWEAAQRLFLDAMRADMAARREGREPSPADDALIGVVRDLLRHPPEDRALLAEMLSLPGEAQLAELFEPIDVAAVVAARDALRRRLGEALYAEWGELLAACADSGPYRFEPAAVARRRLAALALDYRAALDTPEARAEALAHYRAADNMTATMAALNALRDADGPERAEAYDDFEARWRDDPLVLDKWFSLQAGCRLPGTADRIQALLSHPRFDLSNPNRVRAVLGAFARANLPGFHAADGGGHRLFADRILELDQINPQIAARLATQLAPWRRYAAPQGESMRSQLERLAQAGPSSDLREIVERALES
ncbi:aminopeptidase N [Salinisphaera sp. PC39]|uniref:aminopeptidase N n=1 Tax=Salinisphaera sp. PC39 TaxID=1304156 RepID=UPI003340A32A